MGGAMTPKGTYGAPKQIRAPSAAGHFSHLPHSMPLSSRFPILPATLC
jgi:hypothetical protein